MTAHSPVQLWHPLHGSRVRTAHNAGSAVHALMQERTKFHPQQSDATQLKFNAVCCLEWLAVQDAAGDPLQERRLCGQVLPGLHLRGESHVAGWACRQPVWAVVSVVVRSSGRYTGSTVGLMPRGSLGARGAQQHGQSTGTHHLTTSVWARSPDRAL